MDLQTTGVGTTKNIAYTKAVIKALINFTKPGKPFDLKNK